ncbi:hypothetical protein QBC34DRAFT_490695 [Podospora aff. communis PSN243]|uniref:Uncharacterized protein n=1 Tax=Podospora aff. communis PSN243 TaxID=3040156 RepID=A0AAV9H3P6_9PEZI|nr:hypothetical protein QBC34DRAFT_490695 [Podospora aff. communis PSN243]
MSLYVRDDVSRDGFRSSWGRFYAAHGGERVPTKSLKDAFLPKLTPTGNRYLRDSMYFVYDQLQHYGVQVSESLAGNGTLFLKKALQAGKLDAVPDHILALQAQMHAEWLESRTPQQLSGHPEWVLERYFLDISGKPDKTKTTEVVGIPQERHSSRGLGELRAAASRIADLHYATGTGSTQTVYLGWKISAVEKAAKEHAAKEAEADREKAKAREAERDAKHQEYLARMAAAKRQRRIMPGPGPNGRYMVDCKEIEYGFLDSPMDMEMLICWNEKLGVYEAKFDFGALEGAIIFHEDEDVVKKVSKRRARMGYYGEEDYDDEEDEEDGEDDSQHEEDEEEETVGAESRKRKAATGKAPRGRPPKKARRASNPAMFSVRLRCSDTGTGQIYSDPENGRIKFSRPDFATFTATVSMPCVGSRVEFTGRKVAFSAPKLVRGWDDYSDAAAERARVARW